MIFFKIGVINGDMYLTGNYIDLDNRLHQLTTGIEELNTYLLEGSGYLGSWSTTDKITLSKEVRKKFEIFENPQTGTYFY